MRKSRWTDQERNDRYADEMRGDWKHWPSWVLNDWWERRVKDRKRTTYGYGATIKRPAP